MEQFKKDLRQKKTRGTVDLPQDTEIATGSDPKHEGVWVGWYLPLMAVPGWDTKLKGCSVERLVRHTHAAQSSLVQKLGSEQTALKNADKTEGFQILRPCLPRSDDGKLQSNLPWTRNFFVSFHREFRNDELTCSESRESEWKELIYAITSQGTDPADRKVTLRSGDVKLLTDVYAHLAEYVATKDKGHMDAARFMQKEVVGDAEAQKAIEEFRAHDTIETAYRSAVEKVESTSTLAGLSENETLYSDIRGSHEGEECNSHGVAEKHAVHKKPEKTKKSKKHRHGREAGDKENRQAKRRKIDHQESEANTRGHQAQELSTNELK
ncbi:hypothetical protein ColLi_06763 [Colletotrichum liriopes]|uniref:Uncharacterized protein n=1 Tax=Colletotrichum liriopes TaxID=708192 RepID=A0AA37GNJ4_9PEZI|nr:hypothetical protein ColLi_06763 [Colletotrichum liriopes]